MGAKVFLLIVALWCVAFVVAHWTAGPGEYWQHFALYAVFSTAAAVGNYVVAKVYE